MDVIKISDLELFCHHGVLKEENKLGQKFLVTMELYTDLQRAAKEDDINQSINYADVCHYVKEIMETRTVNLIEAAAEQIAESILIQYDSIKKVRIELKKPWAPILLPLNTVSVIIERCWHSVYLAVGSNLGEKEENIKGAIERLEKASDCRVREVSELIVTEPVGDVEQDDFLNGVLRLETLKSPEELLQFIHEIEKELKRERLVHWGPRTIDLDIIYYDDLVMNTERLTIPHKEMSYRRFVLEPLYQIAPNMKHPIQKKNSYELLQQVLEQEAD